VRQLNITLHSKDSANHGKKLSDEVLDCLSIIDQWPSSEYTFRKAFGGPIHENSEVGGG
jgi:hypothetical protein